MSTEFSSPFIRVVPEGYAAVPLIAAQREAGLRLCALVRKKADSVAGHQVLLRQVRGVVAYLGCITDAAGAVREWIELWLQDLTPLTTAASGGDVPTRDQLDERWRRLLAAAAASDPNAFIATGWEQISPPRIVLDPAAGQPVDPAIESPPAGSIPFNTDGALMAARTHAPLAFEAFTDALADGIFDPVRHGRSPLPLGGPLPQTDQDAPLTPDDHWLFLGRHGRWGRLLESLHLKLRMLADAVDAVRATVRAGSRPLLNVAADSFRVAWADAGPALPRLWTARATLVKPGEAADLNAPGLPAGSFTRPSGSTASIYAADAGSLPVADADASLRIRKLDQDAAGHFIDATLITGERLTVGLNDIVRLRLNLAAGRIDLHARMETRTALAGGEWRLRTIPRPLPQPWLDALRAAEGVPLHHVPFDILSLASTPADLYSLAVLAVRTLLVNRQSTLPTALDDLMSLAREVARSHAPDKPLRDRIAAVLTSDPRWLASLGPHRLSGSPIEPAQAYDLIPAEVWTDTLGMIICTLPGIGPDSRCRDVSDAPPGGLHKVFDRVAADLESLLVRTRSLIVIDWRFNREVHALLRSHATNLMRSSLPPQSAAPTPAPAKKLSTPK